jgi:DNA-binding transcriptional MerR regulator
MARLSAKQLRAYDAAGLLAPARTDPETGYRYYHPRQVRTALTIAMLRSLDVPLERIRELLVAGDAEIQALLAGERARCSPRRPSASAWRARSPGCRATASSCRTR